jgi:DNA-binding MarR family transcriptional regulator
LKRVTKAPRRIRSLAEKDTPNPVDECDLSILTDTFGFLIRACQIQTFRGFYSTLGDTGLTPGSYATLAVVGANPGIRQGFVADLLAFREPNMVRLVKELTSAGLILGKRLPHDRRAMGLELTEQGRAFMDNINTQVMSLDDSYTQGLTVAERKTLMSLLKKVLKQGIFLKDSVEFHED